MKAGQGAPFEVFPGRVGLQQRVLPAYRAGLFELLAGACSGGLSVFAGQARPEEAILPVRELRQARFSPAGNVHFFGPASPFYLLWQKGLLAWLERWDPQVLIVEANPRYLSTPLAMRWMRSRRRAVLGWGLGAPAPAGRSPAARLAGAALNAARRSLLRSCAALIAYSRRGAQEYRALGFPADRIFVAPNAVAPRPLESPPERPARFEPRPRVLYVGRLQERKRLDHLLKACAALPEGCRPQLRIVGDGPARAALQELAGAIYPTAEFTGALRGAELQQAYRAADLFVLPGTGGLAVQEAMAHGLPVIVARGDGTQEDLVRPENGWLVPAEDLPALQAALRQALADPAQLRRMGAASFRIVAEEANLEAMVAVFLRALHSVASPEEIEGGMRRVSR